jgi:hypothetical protein
MEAEFLEKTFTKRKNPSRPSGLAIDEHNKLIYLIAVGALAFTAFFTVLTICITEFYCKNSSNALIAIGSISVGALAGIFTRNN